MFESEVVALAKALISCPSVTPRTAGSFNVLEEYLRPLGFESHRVLFKEEGFEPVENIYLRYGKAGPNFCFAGHTDVVPPGDEAAWTVPPFEPQVVKGELIGRGAEDMKGAIAAFMVAAKRFVESGKCTGSISFLITQDEEGDAVNGTRKMLGWMKEQGEKIDHCLVGEPTNPDYLGEMVKHGRRGSISFRLTVRGKQGHAAYPERADNPVTRIVNILHALKSHELDKGTVHFPPSNLEVTTIDVGNPTSNVIASSAAARFNVRFNNLHTAASISAWVKQTCESFGAYELHEHITGEAFLNPDVHLTDIVVDAIKQVTGKEPVLSTTGGTSDARFIKDVCPVIEFGTTGRTAHMVDERVETKTLDGLADIYQRVLEGYFRS
jgi:succinyl-diaminopimelate desuccinylase